MTAHVPFGLDQLETLVALIGDLHYDVDPLNGATDLFYAPDMHAKADAIVSAYTKSAWSPRAVRIFLKTNLPAGYIVGVRQPTGMNGPFPDTVFVISPRSEEEEVRLPEAEVLTPIAAPIADEPNA